MEQKGDFSNVESDLGVLINHICHRPIMYIGSQNLNEIAAFIEGFAYALRSNELRAFNKWLANKFNFPQNWSWWEGMQTKLSEDDVIKNLPSLFVEFLENHES